MLTETQRAELEQTIDDLAEIERQDMVYKTANQPEPQPLDRVLTLAIWRAINWIDLNQPAEARTVLIQSLL